MMQPITIVGGGLAGLSLGIALRRREVPVELHEAGTYPRHRVCGEFISGVRDDVLESLGIADILQKAKIQQTTAWYFREHIILEENLPENARGISRYVLDAALQWRFQELGGTLISPSRIPREGREGLVWCAGRIPSRGKWIGLKCHARGLELRADLEMHLGRNGYVGLARVDCETVNVCGLFRQDKTLSGTGILPRYLRQGGLTNLARKLEESAVDESSHAAVAGFRLGWQQPEATKAVMLGDSSSIIPPFTGNGMSMAFESAEMAVEPMCRYARGEKSWDDVTKAVARKMRHAFSGRQLFAGLMHPFLTLPAGQSFLAAVTRSGLLPFNLCFRALR